MLMSDAIYFDDGDAINAHMDNAVAVDIRKATAEHTIIKECFEQAGIQVVQVPAPLKCQDGVYTANWGLVRGNKVVLSNLPNSRKPEEPYAEQVLKNLGYETMKLPQNIRFSGQGDALPCGEYLFVGSQYRTDLTAHKLLADMLDFTVIGLQTIPLLDSKGQVRVNAVTGWQDSYFYDIDLALAVINPQLIAWCPDAFLPESQAAIRSLQTIEKIEVDFDEALHGFACNLVSTGDVVVMSNRAPKLQAALATRGLQIITPDVSEIIKGGGFIRCTSLTL